MSVEVSSDLPTLEKDESQLIRTSIGNVVISNFDDYLLVTVTGGDRLFKITHAERGQIQVSNQEH